MSEHDEIASFLDATKGDPDDDPVRISRAVVTAYDSGAKLATVVFGAGTTEVPNLHHFAHYTPVVDDDVHCIRIGPDVIILGVIAR